jgi:hypothetical protein
MTGERKVAGLDLVHDDCSICTYRLTALCSVGSGEEPGELVKVGRESQEGYTDENKFSLSLSPPRCPISQIWLRTDDFIIIIIN